MNPDSLIGKIMLGIIRHMVASGGAVIVSKGLLDASTEQQAIGAVMVLVGVGFSIANKVAVHSDQLSTGASYGGDAGNTTQN